MEIIRFAKPEMHIAMWYCSPCGLVHLKMKDILVDLDRDQFSMFANSVVNISADVYMPIGIGEIISCPSHPIGN